MSSTMRTSQRHSVTGAIVGLPTDRLRELRHMDGFLIIARVQLNTDYQINPRITERAVEVGALGRGEISEHFSTNEELGAFLRFQGTGYGTLYVFDRASAYPVGRISDSAWAYIPPGKRYFFTVSNDSPGTLAFEAVGTAL